jgi:hypothetical protein
MGVPMMGTIGLPIQEGAEVHAECAGAQQQHQDLQSLSGLGPLEFQRFIMIGVVFSGFWWLIQGIFCLPA